MTHRLVWLTDIHFDHLVEVVRPTKTTPGRKLLSEDKVKAFCDKVMEASPDSVVITGDISTAEFIEIHLMWLETYLPNVPIYFVLGNHDYYNGSIADVRARLAKYDGTKTRTQWLNVSGVVQLTEKTALVGHDGWYDGGYSDWFKSTLMMNEYFLVDEMRHQPPIVLHKIIRELSKEGADQINTFVEKAAQDGYKSVIFATHVPPFRENSRAPDGRLSDIDWLPNMSCKMMGDALLKVAKTHPDTRFTCLSGHTHTYWEKTYRNNLKCYTGRSDYGTPGLSIKVLEIE